MQVNKTDRTQEIRNIFYYIKRTTNSLGVLHPTLTKWSLTTLIHLEHKNGLE